MHFNTLSALTLLAVFASVHAQSDTATAPTPTSTDGISDCLLACVTQAGASTGCSFGDASCLCSNQQFQEQALTCLQSQCEEADIEAAQAILQSQCGTSASGIISSLSSGATDSATDASTTGTSGPSASNTNALSSISNSISSIASSLSAAASDATNTGNAALKTGFGPDFGGVVGMGVAVAGVIAGAALVL